MSVRAPHACVVLALCLVARSGGAQVTKRIRDAVRQTAGQRKASTEGQIAGAAAKVADTVLGRVASPIDSGARRAAATAQKTVARTGSRTRSETREVAAIREGLRRGRADLAVPFAAGEGSLSDEARRALGPVSRALAQVDGVVLVQGRADPTTPAAAVDALAMRRATAVKEWLVASGTPAARLFAAGDGVAREPGAVVSLVVMR